MKHFLRMGVHARMTGRNFVTQMVLLGPYVVDGAICETAEGDGGGREAGTGVAVGGEMPDRRLKTFRVKSLWGKWRACRHS